MLNVIGRRQLMDSSIDLKAIGNRIQERRKELNISQEQLAEQCDLSISYISLVENGHANISLVSFAKIVQILNFSYDELILGIDPQDEITDDLRNIIKDTSEKERALYLHILQTLKEELRSFD